MMKIHRLSDGRRVELLDVGAEDGEALVLHHGTPSEAGIWKIWDEAASELGLRLLALTRPGYGESDRLPGRKVVDVAAEIGEVLDSLGIETFVTLGWSGGGPHALACAARLEGRCLAAATLAGVAPNGAEDLDFLGGMGVENVREFGAAMKGEAELSQWMETEGAAYRSLTADSLHEAFGSLLPPVDRKALTPDLLAALAETIRTALKKGVRGWMDDDLAFVGPWGFDVRDIRIPTAVWQGRLDMMVPISHGEWLAKNLRRCAARLGSDEGHISLVAGRERDILRGLLELAKPG